MHPLLREERYVFCTFDQDTFFRLNARPLGVFHETEGVTAVLEVRQAETLGLPISPVFALITLAVHSNLLAVGFLAVVAECLAGAGISMNVISAFYHDHLFVPAEDAGQAMEVLSALAREEADNQV